MVPRVVTSYTSESYTETVPVTTTRQVVEECGSYETRMVPKISVGARLYPSLRSPVRRRLRLLPRRHPRGGAGGRSATTAMACEQVFVSRPVVRSVPETTYVQQTRTRTVPVQQTVEVSESRTEMVPVTVNVQVARAAAPDDAGSRDRL